MSRPVVLYDTSALGDARRHAGTGRYTARLLDALRRRDDVVIHAPRPLPPPRSEARPYRWLRAEPALRRASTAAPFDVLHATGGDPALSVAAARQVVTVHDAELWRAPTPPGRRGLALRAYRRALAARLQHCAAVITTSPVTAGEVCAAIGLDRDRVHVVPLGVAPVFGPGAGDGDAELLASLGVAAQRYILWTGSLRHRDPRKALDLLLDAMARAGDSAPPLVLAGAMGDESARLGDLARRRGVALVLAGRREDEGLAALYRNAALCVVPSLHEGFGLPLLEAMACGAPVVASDGGNLPSLAAGAAVIVPAGDAPALATAMTALLHDHDRRVSLHHSGIERAAAFSWDHCAAGTVAVYHEVAAQQVLSSR